ncbi:MAG: hypothetical protein HRT35_11460 [Algicola sp.]|nr:hypothetical protein [Algicola sp.]
MEQLLTSFHRNAASPEMPTLHKRGSWRVQDEIRNLLKIGLTTTLHSARSAKLADRNCVSGRALTSYILFIALLMMSTHSLGANNNLQIATEKAITDLTTLMAAKKAPFDLLLPKALIKISANTPDTPDNRRVFLSAWLKGFELLTLHTTNGPKKELYLNLAPPATEGEWSISGMHPQSVKNEAQRKAYIKALKENSDNIKASNFQSDLLKAQRVWLVFFDGFMRQYYSQTSDADYKSLIDAVHAGISKGEIQNKLIMTVKKRWGKAN